MMKESFSRAVASLKKNDGCSSSKNDDRRNDSDDTKNSDGDCQDNQSEDLLKEYSDVDSDETEIPPGYQCHHSHGLSSQGIKATTTAAASASPSIESKSQHPLHEQHRSYSSSLPSIIDVTVIHPTRVLPPLESPMTQTLNALSQDMDDLRYDHDTPPLTTAATTTVGDINTTALVKQPASTSVSINDHHGMKDFSITMPPPNSRSTPSIKAASMTSYEATNPNRLRIDDDENNGKGNGDNLPANFHQEWSIIPIDIPKTATKSLSIAIIRDTFPALRPQDSKRHCAIKRVIDPKGLGGKYGLKEGDWFIRPVNRDLYDDDHRGTKNRQWQLATFPEIQSWSKQRPYSPIHVLRNKSGQNMASIDSHGNNMQQPAPHLSAISRALQTTVTAHLGTSGAKATALERQPKTQKQPPTEANHKIKDGDDVVPFCLRCNGEKRKRTRIPRFHHPWCRKNHCFDNSGADDIMNRILQGCKLGCKACEQEYQTGKPITKAQSKNLQHNLSCLNNQARLKREQERKEGGEACHQADDGKMKQAKPKKNQQHEGNGKGATVSSRASKRKKSNGSKYSSETRARCSTSEMEIASSSSSSSSSSSDEEKDDDTSMYEPAKKRARIQTLAFGKSKSKPSSHSTASKRKAKSATGKMIGNRQTNQSQVSRQVTPLAVNHGNDAMDLNPGQAKEPIKPKWVPLFDNPWGGEGHLTGDVILYGPKKGNGHYEILLPSSRYKVNPFEIGSSYRTTHCTPEEGFSLISMKRDPLGKIPWGFQVARDEFGHACLVESVDLNSPASAATWIGASSYNDCKSCQLNVNDMIVMVNGKQVGGMSQVGLELLFESTAPHIYLAVSRYKYTDEAARKFAHIENQMFQAMDSAARDKRLIGWQEVGNGVEMHREILNGEEQQWEDKKEVVKEKESTVSHKNGYNLTSSSSTISYDCHRASLNASKTPEVTTRSCHDYPNKAGHGGNRMVGLQPGDMSGQASARGGSDPSSEIEDTDEDENPWLGCVCGEIHSFPKSLGIKMFWIQCESCNAWYDVAEKCVGFTENYANTIKWNCEACSPYDSENEWGENADGATAKALDKTMTADVDATRDNSDLTRDHLSAANLDKGITFSDSPSLSAAMSLVQIKTRPPNQQTDDKNPVIVPPTVDISRKHDAPNQSLPSYETDDNVEQMSQSDGCVLPKKTPNEDKDGNYTRPARPWPRGLKWDPHCGLRTPTNRGKVTKGERRNESLERKEGKIKGGGSPLENGNHSPQNLGVDSHTQDKGNTRSKTITRSAGKQMKINSPETMTKAKDHAFQEGDLVNVEPHSWPGVNNIGGVGRIVAVTVDEDGDRLYNVKYTVNRFTEKEIQEQFITLHNF